MRLHRERHSVSHIGWLRAAVLGANDGIVSTASLVVGVAAANASQADIMLAGTAGLVAGAMSMAAGEYVSVSSQMDTERADLAREARELAADPAAELEELTQIYVGRGLDRGLAEKVADKLMQGDALAAHARDELGITEEMAARPIQAAMTSAGTFAFGAAVPLVVTLLVPQSFVIPTVFAAALISLMVLGGLGARVGNANAARAVIRVGFWGALAMAFTAGIGRLIGTTL